MAGAGGFEPPYGGIKIRCLTAWLRPNMAARLAPHGKRADNSSRSAPPQPLRRTKFACPAEPRSWLTGSPPTRPLMSIAPAKSLGASHGHCRLWPQSTNAMLMTSGEHWGAIRRPAGLKRVPKASKLSRGEIDLRLLGAASLEAKAGSPAANPKRKRRQGIATIDKVRDWLNERRFALRLARCLRLRFGGAR